MILKKEDKEYLLSLDASSLSDAEIDTIFQIIAALPGGEQGQPRSVKGKKVAVLFFLNLLHAEKNRDFSRLSILAQSARP